MKKPKSIAYALTFLMAFAILLSCQENKKTEGNTQQETFSKSKKPTLEDGGSPASLENAPETKKDSSTVGPTAPKSPPRGGRSD